MCVTVGLWKPIELGIENEDLAIKMVDLLSRPAAHQFNGSVAVIGGGATAIDCAITAKQCGAKHVELFMLEKLSEMPLTAKERKELLDFDIEVNGRIRVSKILAEGGKVSGLETMKVALPDGQSFSAGRHARCARDGKHSHRFQRRSHRHRHALYSAPRAGRGHVLRRRHADRPEDRRPGHRFRQEHCPRDRRLPQAAAQNRSSPNPIKSYYALPGYNPVPVSLATEFFGRPIRSPYLISASPSTDGLEQMTLAYEAGWAGGVMKTAFDNVPIHIPGEYMFAFSPYTYANSDNVSGHPLDRVCREVEQLVKQWPDRLTMASTGGPVTGQEECDAAGWQSNTKKLEAAGAMGIEYSLSCPQGGDGTEGDIVSQNAALTARIIDWIMQVGDPDIPKLFKLTAAVTSIVPILRAIRNVLDKYPHKKAGITLANSFPTLAFRPAARAPLGRGRHRRDERRRRNPDFVPDPGNGCPGGHRDLRQRRSDELQSRHGFPRPGRQDRPVLHDRDEAGLWHHP